MTRILLTGILALGLGSSFFFVNLASAADKDFHRLVPYMDIKTGRLRGYLKQPINADDALETLGIRDGDTLTEINGVKVNATHWAKTFERLKPVPTKNAARVAEDERTLLNP